LAAAALPAAFTLDAKLDHDTWWHLRVGRLIAESGRVPDFDSFSRLGEEKPTPWIAYSWLYDRTLYEVYAEYGPHGVLWVRTLLGALSTAAVFSLLPSRGWRTLAAALLVAITLMPLMKERPWHFTIAFAALTTRAVMALRDGSPAARYWLLVPMYA